MRHMWYKDQSELMPKFGSACLSVSAPRYLSYVILQPSIHFSVVCLFTSQAAVTSFLVTLVFSLYRFCDIRCSNNTLFFLCSKLDWTVNQSLPLRVGWSEVFITPTACTLMSLVCNLIVTGKLAVGEYCRGIIKYPHPLTT